MGKGLGYFTNYPMHVFLVLANEFCERFSFYGMKAVLVFFLWKALEFPQSTATALYHTFVVLCYATPILGAIIADGFLGKYKTIVYLSIIYACGSVLMTATSIPYGGSYIRWAPFIALVIIAFGTGGIKPCVSSFGGDQFKEDQQRQKDSFFSLFYLCINIGSLISTIFIPYIRGNIYCFDDSCYALCFGIPAALMIISIVMFLIGTKWYTRHPPGESIISRMIGCCSKALSRKCGCCSKEQYEKKEHWLDYAAPDYDQSFIEDVKDVMRVTWLFIPLPVFWALFDQQGSRWTLQAQQMNGDFDGIVIFPDMIQFMNPLLVVIAVPLLESVIYPCLDKLKIPNRPLQRMTLGMIFAATAFLIAGFLQIAINADIPPEIEAGKTKVSFINSSPCPIKAYSAELNQYQELPSLEASDYYYMTAGSDKMFNVTYQDCTNFPNAQDLTFNYTFAEKTAYQIFFTGEFGQVRKVQSVVTLTDKGEATARVFNNLPYGTHVYLKTTEKQESEPRDLGFIPSYDVSAHEKLIYADFYFDYTDRENVSHRVTNVVKSKNGPVYTILLSNDTVTETGVNITQLTEIGAWTLNIFLQTPQYVIITFGECLFSVTGLGFAYTQAPPSMKSILTAIWLLTVCFGNIIVIIVAEAGGDMSQVGEFFLFAGLMYVTTVIFAIMACFYKKEDRTPTEVIEVKSEEGKDNPAVEMGDEPGYDKIKLEDETGYDNVKSASPTVPNGKDSSMGMNGGNKIHPVDEGGDNEQSSF